MDGLSEKARAHSYASLERLRQLGHQLRRPEVDYLADGIYELRFRCEGLNYRILYFFHAREAVVISHGMIKQQARVHARDLDLARKRRLEYLANPSRHAYGEFRP